MSDKPSTPASAASTFDDLPSVKLETIRNRLDNECSKWLRLRGWQYTSSTPGSYWMWTKEWDGKHFLVDEKTAERIQDGWDRSEYVKQHPDEFRDE
jgi:hypothetical protein